METKTGNLPTEPLSDIRVGAHATSALVLPEKKLTIPEERNEEPPRVRKTRKKPESRAQTTTLAERIQIIEALEENARTHRYRYFERISS